MRFCFTLSFLALAAIAAEVVSFSIPTASGRRLHNSNNHGRVLRMTKTPVFDEVCETTGVTLKRFMAEVSMLNPELEEIQELFGAIETACKAISNLVKRSQLPSSETLGYAGNGNVQGEDQKKLDVMCNDLLKRALRFTGRLGVLASEEEDTPVSCSSVFSGLFRVFCPVLFSLPLWRSRPSFWLGFAG